MKKPMDIAGWTLVVSLIAIGALAVTPGYSHAAKASLLERFGDRAVVALGDDYGCYVTKRGDSATVQGGTLYVNSKSAVAPAKSLVRRSRLSSKIDVARTSPRFSARSLLAAKNAIDAFLLAPQPSGASAFAAVVDYRLVLGKNRPCGAGWSILLSEPALTPDLRARFIELQRLVGTSVLRLDYLPAGVAVALPAPLIFPIGLPYSKIKRLLRIVGQQNQIAIYLGM